MNKVILLGTGTPNACFDAMGPSVALIIHDKVYVVDAGAGVVRQLTKLYNKGYHCCSPKLLDTLFLTHLHSDHTVGLPDFIYTPWVLERDHPLTIVGPNGTKEMCGHLQEAYTIDINFRIHGFEKANDSGYLVNVIQTKDGLCHEDENVKVYALTVEHGLESYAYKFVFDGKSVVISGDTCYLESMCEFCRDVDLLVHEVFYSAGLKQREPKWQVYHSHVHTSSYDLARLASIAKPKKLVTYHRIYHMDFYNDAIDVVNERNKRENAILEEIKSKYDGIVMNGHDLDEYEI